MNGTKRTKLASVPARVETWFYCRYSSDRQNDRSIEQQVEASNATCDRLGIPHPTAARVYADRAKSGKSMRGRDALKRMIEDAQSVPKSPSVQRVLVLWDVDRLGRNLFDSIGVAGKLYQELGFRIVDCHGLDSTDERFKADLVRSAESADYFLVRLARNIKRGVADARAKGHSLGKCPYGFKRVNKVNVVDPAQAKWVRWIFTKIVELDGNVSETTRLLRRQPTGAKWRQRATVQRLVRSSRYVDAGIVSRQLWDRVQTVVSERATHFERTKGGWLVSGRGTDKSPARGLLRCAACGGTVCVVARDAKGRRRLGCYGHYQESRCASPASVQEGVLLEAIANEIRTRIIDAKAIDTLTSAVAERIQAASAQASASLPELDAAIADRERKIARFVRQVEESDDVIPELGARLKELRGELAELRAQREAATGPAPAPVRVLRSAVESYLPRLATLLAEGGPGANAALRELVRDGKIHSDGVGRVRVTFNLAPLGAFVSIMTSDRSRSTSFRRPPRRCRTFSR